MSLTVPAEGRGRGWEKDVRKRVGGGEGIGEEGVGCYMYRQLGWY